jgi:hypothetical protein
MGKLIKTPNLSFLEMKAGVVPGSAGPSIEEWPGMFLHMDQLRTRLILRHRLTVCAPLVLQMANRLYCNGSHWEGPQEYLNLLLANALIERQCRVKSKKVLTKVGPCSTWSAEPWCEYLIKEFTCESNGQKTLRESQQLGWRKELILHNFKDWVFHLPPTFKSFFI